MKILDRYIAATVAANFAFALGGLLAVFSVINFTQELKDVGTEQYALSEALWFVLMTLPVEAYSLFPAAALLGTVNGLGALASHNEIVAISAAGLSRQRLTQSVMQAAAFLMVLTVVVGEFIAAPMAQRARTRRSIAVSGGSVLSTAKGVWARDGSTFVNIRTPLLDGALRDVFLYDLDEERHLQRFTYAHSAAYTDERWELEGLVASDITGRGVTTERVPAEAWDTSINPHQLRILFLPPDDLSLIELRQSIESMSERGESSRRHRLAFWRRVTMPFVTGIMVCLAIPFVLTALRGVSIGQRIVAGALVGIGFQMFSHTFGQFGLVYGLGPFLTAAFPPALALAAYVLWNQRGDW